MGRRLFLVVATASLLLSGATATRAGGLDAESDRVLASGRSALTAGDTDGARRLFEEALALAPASAEALGELLTLDAEDADARAVWTLALARAAVDENGRWKPARGLPLDGPETEAAAQAVRLRAKAVQVVRKTFPRLKKSQDVPTRRLLTSWSRVLGSDCPTLVAGHDAAVDGAHAGPDEKTVLTALEGVMRRAAADGDWPLALRAGLLLRGIDRQGHEEEAAAAPPSKSARAAADTIERAREHLAAAPPRERDPPAEGEEPATGTEPRVHTLEELEAIAGDQVAGWNAAHRSWEHPGIAVSPGGLYRIETTAGWNTLRHVTSVVEDLHARIAGWFGSDPFDGRPGLIRVVLDHAELEGEGAPFWWAGGFQSGDRTTVLARFRSGDALDGTLIHELTHRFDHAAFGGLPAWLAEGRAVFVETGGWGRGLGRVVVEAADWMKLWETHDARYHDEDNLLALLGGKPKDYRDNYHSGYSLWLFLTRFRGFDGNQEGAFVFADRVSAYLDGFAKRSAPDSRAWFEKHFVDGKTGRPNTLEGFRELFRQFIREGGSGAEPGAAWKQAWQRRVAELRVEDRASRTQLAPRDLWTTDTAPRPGDRDRHDPPARGLDHARRAARVLAAAGRPRAALAAIDWAVAVDDVDPSELQEAVDLHDTHKGPSAWVYRALLHRLAPHEHPAPEGGAGGTLAAAHRAVAAYLTHLAKWSDAAHDKKRLRLASALRADHDRIAAICGIAAHRGLPAAGAKDKPVPVPEAAGPPAAPWRPAERSVVAGEMVEERWAPIDSKPGIPWHIDGAGNIVLGQAKTDDTTGGLIRDAGMRRMFVRSSEWLDDAYTLRTRIRFLSSFADGRIVFGKTSRDRGFSVRFRAGDWDYSTGKKDAVPPLQSAGIHVTDHRPLDRYVSPMVRFVTFEQPRAFLDIEIRVAGPYVVVLLDGEERVSHRRRSGAPIEGYVGFALSRGVVRFEQPRVRRERTIGPDREAMGWSLDAPLRLAQPNTFPWRTIIGRRVEGLPAHPGGTLLLWLPADAGEDSWDAASLMYTLRWFSAQFTGLATSHVTRLAVPASDLASETLEAELRTGEFVPDSVEMHHGHAGLSAVLAEHAKRPGAGPTDVAWVMLDETNVVRSAVSVARIRHARFLARLLAGEPR